MRAGHRRWARIVFWLVVSVVAVLAGLFIYDFVLLRGGDGIVDVSKGREVRPGQEVSFEVNWVFPLLLRPRSAQVELRFPKHLRLVRTSFEGAYDVNPGSVVFRDIGWGRSRRSFVVTFSVANPLDNGTRIPPLHASFVYRFSWAGITLQATSGLWHEVKSSPDFRFSEAALADENGGELTTGDLVKCEILIKNTGDMDARNLRILDFVPSNCELVDFFAAGSYGLELAQEDGRPVIRVGELRAGEQEIVRLKARVKEGLKDKTVVALNPLVRTPQGDFVVKGPQLLVRVYPDFSSSSITASDLNGGSLMRGDDVLFKIKLENTGKTTATDILVRFTAPAHSELVLEESSPEVLPDGKELVWKLVKLDVGESKSADLILRVGDEARYGDAFALKATVSCNELRPLEIRSDALRVVAPFSLRVVFLGDSQMVKTDWASRFASKIKRAYPLGSFEVVNSAISGEYSSRAYSRLPEAVYRYSPDIVVVGFGTNDSLEGGGYFLVDPESFRYYMSRIVYDIRAKTGARVILVSPAPVDESKRKNHSNKTIETYCSLLAWVAANRGAVYVDVFHPMIADPGYLKYLSEDGLHYSPEGAEFVARKAFAALSTILDPNGYPK